MLLIAYLFSLIVVVQWKGKAFLGNLIDIIQKSMFDPFIYAPFIFFSIKLFNDIESLDRLPTCAPIQFIFTRFASMHNFPMKKTIYNRKCMQTQKLLSVDQSGWRYGKKTTFLSCKFVCDRIKCWNFHWILNHHGECLSAHSVSIVIWSIFGCARCFSHPFGFVHKFAVNVKETGDNNWSLSVVFFAWKSHSNGAEREEFQLDATFYLAVVRCGKISFSLTLTDRFNQTIK